MAVVLHLKVSDAANAAAKHGAAGSTRVQRKPTLWIQDHTAAGRLVVDKIKGTENVADIGTKPLPGPTFVKLRALLGLVLARVAGGREVEFPATSVNNSSGSNWFMYLVVLVHWSGLCWRAMWATWPDISAGLAQDL